MKAKPKTTYVTASPATWELIRAAYLSGLSAPTAAARFGVSVGALRKRAQREGWTKRVYAAAPSPFSVYGLAVAGGQPPAPPAPSFESIVAATPADAEAAEASPHIATLFAQAAPPPQMDPITVARMAATEASRQLVSGNADGALRQIRAAEALIALDAKIEDGGYQEEEDPENAEARQSALNELVFQVAGELAGLLLTGGEVPPGYLARAERWRAEYEAMGVFRDARQAK